MKKFMCISIAIICCIILVACGSSENHTGKSKTPSDSSSMNGLNYKSVVESFEDNGFTNIKLEKIEDLITGWLIKEGEVEEVSVGGNFDYSSGEWIDADTEVIIRYHTFSEKETETTQYKSEENEEQEDISDEILTINNCEELANMLSNKADIDESYSSFASKYHGRIIEFDGNIAHLMNYKNYKTRYDILVYAGDFSYDSVRGPAFKFENRSAYEFDGIYLNYQPEDGKNVRITAMVGTFDSNSGLFYLYPKSVTER
ncbi:DUF4839 domain-containing protein [Terrisporobacter muris]|uniref:DUF4839 domain-containing protein n=1 Tax=Terrisporobacter muris TaxID=2963284 RepID=A0A9X2S3C8_9FIRM|nr:DUF4839 domain-containing protein [Terrisporobacter muris]MCR1824938.1 DUF4839 domain-containing protein [Terrisporobacter muris]SCH73873.1 Uncharacterised protein [uncultured Clostridium sp.]